MFPEACSTNGTHVIKLSKGAFYSLRKVRPTVFNYHEISSIKASQDVAGFIFHTLVVMSCLGISMDFKVLPVFEPNEFFWKNHWREGKEEKWECYARVVQEIMAEVGGYPMSDLTMRDKFDFKKQLTALVKNKQKAT